MDREIALNADFAMSVPLRASSDAESSIGGVIPRNYATMRGVIFRYVEFQEMGDLAVSFRHGGSECIKGEMRTDRPPCVQNARVAHPFANRERIDLLANGLLRKRLLSDGKNVIGRVSIPGRVRHNLDRAKGRRQFFRGKLS